jgi:hypothetical protein
MPTWTERHARILRLARLTHRADERLFTHYLEAIRQHRTGAARAIRRRMTILARRWARLMATADARQIANRSA